MYDNNSDDGSRPPSLPEKTFLRRRRSSHYAPLLDDLQQLDDRDRIASNGQQLSDEIDRLAAEVKRIKMESTPYPSKEEPSDRNSFPQRRHGLQSQRGNDQADLKSFSAEESFIESIHKLTRPNVTKKDLPIFDGTESKSFKMFLQEFEDITKLGQWSDEDKLAALPTILEGRPKLYYHRLDPKKKKTYENAIKAIEKMFDSPENICILRRELRNIQQGELPLVEYLERLEYLFTELSVPEDRHLDLLTGGLREDLQDYLDLKEIKTYDSAVRSLKMKESVRRTKPVDARLTAICDKLSAIEERLDEAPAVKAAVNNNQADVAALLREINRLKSQNRSGQRGYNRSNGYNQGNGYNQRGAYSQRNTYDQRNAQNCQNCGKQGHTEETCRSPRKRTVGDLLCWNCGGKGHRARQCGQMSANVRCLEEAKGEGPLLAVTIGAFDIDALCDSGAQKSVLSETFAKKLGLSITKSEEKARGIGGSYLHIIGHTQFEVEIAGRTFTIKPMVLRDVTHQLLLGIDFLQ
eukprot:TCONS_00054086-protein